MTDITDLDRRLAREWATMMKKRCAAPLTALAAADVILATVEAPPATLAEELRIIASGFPSTTVEKNLLTLADRADELEERTRQAESYAGKYHEAIQQRDEARAERDEFMNDMISSERKQAKLEAEVERLARNPETKARVEEALSNLDQAEAVQIEYVERLDAKELFDRIGSSAAPTLPDPADVKPGEAWIVDVDGERRPAVKDGEDYFPWNTINGRSWISSVRNEDVTLITRLVPAPRVITNPEDLDKLAPTSIFRDGSGCPGGITDQGAIMRMNTLPLDSTEMLRLYGPVTVLWEPEVTA